MTLKTRRGKQVERREANAPKQAETSRLQQRESEIRYARCLIDRGAATTAIFDLETNGTSHAIREAQVTFRRRNRCRRSCGRICAVASSARLQCRGIRGPRWQRLGRGRPDSTTCAPRKLCSAGKRCRRRTAQSSGSRREAESAQSRETTAAGERAAKAGTTGRLRKQRICDRMRCVF